MAGRLMNWQPAVPDAQVEFAVGLYQTPLVSQSSSSPSPSVSSATVQLNVAGVASTLPARSTAATENMCAPTASPT